jgi:3',5'-cyclic AMP phosphodiesterase CpdA
MRIVLIGDVHVSIRTLQPWRWLGKRFIGQLNSALNPRRKFKLEYLPAIVERAASLAPNWVLMSGDLTTTALPAEFRRAVQGLAPLTDRFPAVCVAGNHDVYTFGSSWLKRMQRLMPKIVPRQYPQFQRIGDGWHLLAVNSSVARLWSSRGKIGKAQMKGVRAALGRVSADEGVIVLSHYSVGKPMALDKNQNMPVSYGLRVHDESSKVRPQKWAHQLEDQAEFLRALGECRARVLLMHGHVHRPWVWRRPEPGLQHVIDINAGSPVLLSEAFPCGQGFWEFELPEGAGDASSKPVIARHHLALPAGGVGGPEEPRGEPKVEWIVRVAE